MFFVPGDGGRFADAAHQQERQHDDDCYGRQVDEAGGHPIGERRHLERACGEPLREIDAESDSVWVEKP